MNNNENIEPINEFKDMPSLKSKIKYPFPLIKRKPFSDEDAKELTKVLKETMEFLEKKYPNVNEQD